MTATPVDLRISALTEANAIQPGDGIPVLRAGATVRAEVGTAAAKTASDNTKTNVASVSGATVAGHVATFVDTAGTVQDGGTLAAVATSGSYSDLANKPTLGTMASQSAGAVAITGGTITGLGLPTAGADVATKSYVDNVTAGLSQKPSARVATTANLTATYANGASGVGATLTNSSTLAALTIDGVALSVGDRVAVKNQATAFQNGLYTVTVAGTGSVAWVLTRAADFDGHVSGEVIEGAFFVVEEGTANAGTLWIETGQGPFTIGTTAITFTELQVGSQTVTLSGDATGTGAGSIVVTVAKLNGVPAGSYARVDQANTYTATQQGPAGTLTDGASIAWNAAAVQQGAVTLAGNRALANPSNLTAGAYALIVKQDATGSRTLSFGTAYKWPGGIAPTLSTGANAVDILSFLSDGTNMYGVAQLSFA